MSRSSSIIESESVILTWKNINIETQGTKKRNSRVILNDVSGQAKSGEFMAIMGPSGAGKTTLLNILSQKFLGKGLVVQSSSIQLNGQIIERENFKRIIGFVPQDDILMESLTPREAIQISADISLKLSVNKRREIVEDIIKQLGIESCANTKIGGSIIRGISGGERKRTSIGVELVTNPPILFLDEPTTGLDSYTALKIVELISTLARTQNRLMISTIHQPSSEIFLKFGNLLLLSQGNVVYCGKLSKSEQYFASKGLPVPDNYNPADFYMNVLSKDEALKIDDFNVLLQVEHQMESLGNSSNIPQPKEQPSAWKKFTVLGKRTLLDTVRNPMIIYTKIMKLIVTSTLVLIAYWDLGTSNTNDIFDRWGAIYVITTSAYLETMMGTCSTFHMDKAIFLREYSSRKYGVFPFFLSYQLVILPYEILWSLLFLSIVYTGINLNPDYASFFQSAAAVILAGMCGTSLGLFISVIAPTIEIASALQPSVFIPFMLTSGYLKNFGDIADWFFVKYISPFAYGFSALSNAQFDTDGNLDSQLAKYAKDELHLVAGYGLSMLYLGILALGVRIIAIYLLFAKSRNLQLLKMFRRIFRAPPSDVFPYQSERTLRIKDIALATFYNVLLLVTVSYYIIYVMIILRKWSVITKDTGWVYYQARGKVFSQDQDGNIIAWDATDLISPSQDSTGFFVPIHLFLIRNQQMGYCTTQCVNDSDCANDPPLRYSRCESNGYCSEFQWCPNMDQGTTYGIESIRLQGTENLHFYIWTGIAFDQYNSPDYSNNEDESLTRYDSDNAVDFRLRDILSEADIDNIDDIRYTGAIIHMQMKWDCNIDDSDCDPNPTWHRRDAEDMQAPIIVNSVEHRYVDGELRRDYFR